MFVCLRALPLCGSVTDRMRPLTAEGAGETINTARQGVQMQPSRYVWRGRLLSSLAEEEPGEYGHALAVAPRRWPLLSFL